MKTGTKILIILASCAAIAMLLWWTGILFIHQMSENHGMSGEYTSGERVWVSNLKTPKSGDVIIYQGPNDVEGVHYAARLVALPGDTLQMIDGYVYVNSTLLEKQEKVRLSYQTDKASENSDAEVFLSKAELVNYPNAEALKFDPNSKAYLYYFNGRGIRGYMDMGWTFVNFGPIILIEDEYFVLNDDRHTPFDSRYHAAISGDLIRGLVW